MRARAEIFLSGSTRLERCLACLSFGRAAVSRQRIEGHNLISLSLSESQTRTPVVNGYNCPHTDSINTYILVIHKKCISLFK